MNRKSIILILVVIAAVAFKYWNDNQKTNSEAVQADDDTEYVAPQEQLMQQETQSEKNETESVKDQQNGNSSTNEETYITPSVSLEKLLRENLNIVVQCLEIPSVQWPDSLEPTLSDVNSVLKQGMGEMVVYMDDWVETTVDLGDGTKRNIREEISYENPKNPSKYLMVYKFVEGSAPEMEKLDATKSINPTTDYIDSFKVGSVSSSEEKGGRAYYENGNEMVVIEKDGQVESISIARKNKYITCSDLNTLDGECSCQQ